MDGFPCSARGANSPWTVLEADGRRGLSQDHIQNRARSFVPVSQLRESLKGAYATALGWVSLDVPSFVRRRVGR